VLNQRVMVLGMKVRRTWVPIGFYVTAIQQCSFAIKASETIRAVSYDGF
jgi:hypothetical protein